MEVKSSQRKLKKRHSRSHFSSLKFGGLSSQNVNRSCVYSQEIICCSALEDVKIKFRYNDNLKDINGNCCYLNVTYIPSELEELYFQRIKSSSSDDVFSLYLNEDYTRKTKEWLHYVSSHMANNFEYNQNIQRQNLLLSRFHVEKICGERKIGEWDEYIEPLTIHARHPFAKVTPVLDHIEESKIKPPAKDPSIPSSTTISPFPFQVVEIMDIDYILLQSLHNIEKRFIFSAIPCDRDPVSMKYQGEPVNTNTMDENSFASANSSFSAMENKQKATVQSSSIYQTIESLSAITSFIRPKFYLFDAGSSTFYSSMWFFACAYSQRGNVMNLNHITPDRVIISHFGSTYITFN